MTLIHNYGHGAHAFRSPGNGPDRGRDGPRALEFRRRTPGVGGEVPARGDPRLPAAPAPRGTALRRLLIRNYTPTDDALGASGEIAILPKEVRTGMTLLQPGEHPFPTWYASENSMMRIEPSIYLEALLADFHSFGGRSSSECSIGSMDVVYLGSLSA